MLRTILIGLVSCFLVAAVAMSFYVGAALIGPIILLSMCLFGLIFERYRYRQLNSNRPDPRYQPNGERFIDPESGAPVTVYTDAATGDRRYVKDRD